MSKFGVPPGILDDFRRNWLEISRKQDVEEESIRSTNLMASIAKNSMASVASKQIRQIIEFFEKSLDQEHEVGAKLVSYGQSMTIHILDVKFQDPGFVIFLGATTEGDRVMLVQHTSQISFLLMAMPRLEPEGPPRRFGFAQGHKPHPDEPGQGGQDAV